MHTSLFHLDITSVSRLLQTCCLVLAGTLCLLTGNVSAHEHGDHHDHASHEHGHGHVHGAHVHGTAALNLSIEDRQVEVELISPLANFLSFEHRPDTPEQKKAADDMLLRLENSDLLLFPEAAGCHRTSRHIHADALQKQDGSAAASYAHSDIELHETYTCADAKKISHVKTRIFEQAEGLRTVNVQMILPDGQKSGTFTRSVTTLSW